MLIALAILEYVPLEWRSCLSERNNPFGEAVDLLVVGSPFHRLW